MIIDIELHSTHPTERRAWFDPPWNRGSHRADAPPARRHLAHRLPAARRPEHRGGAAAGEPCATFVQRHLDAIGEGHLPLADGVDIGLPRRRDDAGQLPPRPRAVRRQRGACDADLRRARAQLGLRRRRQPGLEAGLVARGDCRTRRCCDSYSQERIAAFHINAESAMRSTEFMSPPSRGFDLLREAALSLSGRHRGIADLINPRQTAGGALRRLGAVAARATPGRPGRQPGEVMPELPVGRRRRPSHAGWLGPGFVLLHFGARRAGAGDRRGWCCGRCWARPTARWPLALVDTDGGVRRAFGADARRASTCCAPTAMWPRAGGLHRRGAWQPRCARALGHADAGRARSSA